MIFYDDTGHLSSLLVTKKKGNRQERQRSAQFPQRLQARSSMCLQGNTAGSDTCCVVTKPQAES